MEAQFSASKWTQKAQVLAGILVIATVINVVLLLLIASLVNCKNIERDPTPQLRPIDFIRLSPKPKPPEPKPEPPPPEEKIVEKVIEPPVKPKEEPKPPIKKANNPIKKALKKPSKVAAPKLDIPLDGTGSSFANVAGKDTRLTAPPTKWDVKQEPDPPKKAPITRRLIAVSRVMPVYPWRPKAMGIEGWVKLEVIVDTDGSVSQVTVVDDKPKDMFAQAAVKAIKQWRFKPAFIDGQAVEQRALQLMEFQLRN